MIPVGLAVELAASSTALWYLTAEAAENFPVDIGVVGQYGVLGILNYILFRFALQAYNREKERADSSDAEVARLNQKIQDEYIASLKASNTALTESNRTLAEVAEKLPRRRS